MRRMLWAAMAAIALGGGLSAAPAPAKAAETVKITFVSGHPPIFTWSKHYLETLIPAIDQELAKTGNYEVDWNKAFGGALAKAGEEFEAIEDGIADFGQSLSGFEPAKMPLQNVGFAAPFQPLEPTHSAIVLEKLQKEIPALGGVWEKHNQIYLGGGISADIYNVWSTKPIKTVDDLKGMKLGGAPPIANYIDGTGAVHVNTAMSENYNSMKSGLVDGVVNFVTGAMPGKYYEVAKHVTVINLGSPFFGGLVVNKDRWEGFPQEVRDAIQKGVDIFTEAFYADLRAKIDGAWKALEETGSNIYKFDDEQRKKWANMLRPVGKEWVENMEKRGLPGREVLTGYMNGMRELGYTYPRDWDKEL